MLADFLNQLTRLIGREIAHEPMAVAPQHRVERKAVSRPRRRLEIGELGRAHEVGGESAYPQAAGRLPHLYPPGQHIEGEPGLDSGFNRRNIRSRRA
jgi:hypothetical protein